MKTILLTGATDGIGLEAAKLIARDNHTLLLHGRNEQKLREIKDLLLEENHLATVKTFVADFSDLSQVRIMAKSILENYETLDVLINNAGVFVVSEQERITKDGLDVRFSVNTASPYILAKTLFPLMTSDSRIINLSSAAQAPFTINTLKHGSHMEADEAYAKSKLALIMWSIDMSKDHPPGPLVFSINPKSFLGTKMVQEAYGQQGYDLRIGADILYRAAFFDDFNDANGLYFDNDIGHFSNPHPFAFNENARFELMEYLETLV